MEEELKIENSQSDSGSFKRIQRLSSDWLLSQMLHRHNRYASHCLCGAAFSVPITLLALAFVESGCGSGSGNGSVVQFRDAEGQEAEAQDERENWMRKLFFFNSVSRCLVVKIPIHFSFLPLWTFDDGLK